MTQYSGKVIRKTPVTPTQQSASGVWKLNEQAAAIRNNSWPVPGVPDPISRSVRFRSSASAYFSRTFGTPTNNLKWTWSGWVKRGKLGTAQTILGGAAAGTGQFPLYFTANDQLAFYDSDGVSTYYQIGTTAVFRDPSAWYHIVIVFDSANATQANRLIIYVNNVSQALSSIGGSPGGLLPLNRASYWNASGAANNIGCYYTSSTANNPLDGYITESVLVDGQALTPSSFGTTDTATGAWIPMPYTGTYGANGFYLNFKDNTSTTTIGYDYSGNANNWTANNISLTSGSTYDSMLDVPTPWVGYSTTTDTSAVTRGNYAVLNPISGSVGSATISNGNLYSSVSATSAYGGAKSTIGIAQSSGKWYFEVTATSFVNSGSVWMVLGLTKDANLLTAFQGQTAGSLAYAMKYNTTGAQICNETTAIRTDSGIQFAQGDVLQCAFDSATGKLWFGKNNAWFDSTSGTTGNPSAGTNQTLTTTITDNLFPFVQGFSTSGASAPSINFGQQPLTYAPPTGFKTLVTTNLPTPTIANGATVMAATTYTGNGGTQSITNTVNGVSMQPDLVWVKARSVAYNNYLTDSVRGAGKELSSNLTDAESSFNLVSALNNNGFTVFTNGTYLASNQNGTTYVGWQWQAGAGTTSSNTNGSITSTVSVNATAGFSVVTYTGDGSSSATVGHGLGVTPAMIICKSRSATTNWYVKHQNLASQNNLLLAGTDAQFNVVSGSSTGGLGNLTSSTTFSFLAGTANVNAVNASGATYVAYCFAEVAGFSKLGSYQGNGSSDGPFVFCNFRPRFVMIKRIDAAGFSWTIEDSSRSPYNASDKILYANLSDAENTGTARNDFLSNGFKARDSGNNNVSGGTYIFAAFAENPFKYSNAR